MRQHLHTQSPSKEMRNKSAHTPNHRLQTHAHTQCISVCIHTHSHSKEMRNRVRAHQPRAHTQRALANTSAHPMHQQLHTRSPSGEMKQSARAPTARIPPANACKHKRTQKASAPAHTITKQRNEKQSTHQPRARPQPTLANTCAHTMHQRCHTQSPNVSREMGNRVRALNPSQRLQTHAHTQCISACMHNHLAER